MSDSLDSTNPDSAAAPADASGSESSLTDAHHDWVSSFTGIDTRATATSSGSGDSGGGVWGALSGAVSAAAPAGVLSNFVGGLIGLNTGNITNAYASGSSLNSFS